MYNLRRHLQHKYRIRRATIPAITIPIFTHMETGFIRIRIETYRSILGIHNQSQSFVVNTLFRILWLYFPWRIALCALSDLRPEAFETSLVACCTISHDTYGSKNYLRWNYFLECTLYHKSYYQPIRIQACNQSIAHSLVRNSLRKQDDIQRIYVRKGPWTGPPSRNFPRKASRLLPVERNTFCRDRWSIKSWEGPSRFCSWGDM